MPGSFELGVARREGTLGKILQEVTAAVQETKRSEKVSIVALAMEAACTDRTEAKLSSSSLT